MKSLTRLLVRGVDIDPDHKIEYSREAFLVYGRRSRWKREVALRRPGERTGFRVIARKRR